MIVNPISYSQQVRIHIDKYDGKDHTYWNVTCDQNKAIRKEIREFYRTEQSFHCAYCNRLRQDFNGAQWDIDHIIPKQSHPQYLYTPKNLTVTCKDCNGKKGKGNVLVDHVDASLCFPISGESYAIIHPHFDEYLDNIRCRTTADGKIIHEPFTPKGIKTFNLCGLIRFSDMIAGTSEVIEETGESLDLTDGITEELREAFDRQISEFDYLSDLQLAQLLKGKLSQITGVMV
ncbi:TPA: HNH endonuclease [Cronobacter turicensis]|nr:HNH endonuclease [Cronobacter turicensis]